MIYTSSRVDNSSQQVWIYDCAAANQQPFSPHWAISVINFIRWMCLRYTAWAVTMTGFNALTDCLWYIYLYIIFDKKNKPNIFRILWSLLCANDLCCFVSSLCRLAQILPKIAAETFVSDMESRTLAVADLWALMLIWRIFKYKTAPFTHYVAARKWEKSCVGHQYCSCLGWIFWSELKGKAPTSKHESLSMSLTSMQWAARGSEATNGLPSLMGTLYVL